LGVFGGIRTYPGEAVMKKYFSVAAKAVILLNDKVLLLDKSDLEDVNPNTVDIPGGGLEFGEKPEDGLAREVFEETGLDIVVVRPTRTWTLYKEDQERQLVGITFLCKLTDDSMEPEPNLSHEHTKSYWVLTADILKGEYPKWLKEEVEAAINCI
jgi:8-oxo-dGTP diphosphatase